MWLSHLIYIMVWGELVRGQVAAMNSSVIGRNNASLSVPLHGHSRGSCVLILGLRKLRHSVLLVHHHVVLINLSPRTLTTLRIPPHIIPNIQPSLFEDISTICVLSLILLYYMSRFLRDSPWSFSKSLNLTLIQLLSTLCLLIFTNIGPNFSYTRS